MKRETDYSNDELDPSEEYFKQLVYTSSPPSSKQVPCNFKFGIKRASEKVFF